MMHGRDQKSEPSKIRLKETKTVHLCEDIPLKFGHPHLFRVRVSVSSSLYMELVAGRRVRSVSHPRIPSHPIVYLITSAPGLGEGFESERSEGKRRRGPGRKSRPTTW